MARGYGQKDCPVARTLDVIGEKWTVLVLRDLFREGPLALSAAGTGAFRCGAQHAVGAAQDA